MYHKQIVNVDRVKQVNTAAIYRLIDLQGPISRIQLSEQSQLAPASVTKITRQLLASGLIQEVAQQASTGGRRAISLMTLQRPYQFISARLGRGVLDISLYDLSGSQQAHQQLSVQSKDPNEVTEQIIEDIDAFIEQYHDNQPLIAVTLTLSGLVATASGTVVYTPHYEFRDFALGSKLEEHYKLPIFLGNDTRAMALSEHYFGASQDCLDSALISVRNGTSAGIIIGGEVFMRQHRDVGEIGHIQIDPLGELCQCGNLGCLETVVSNKAIENRVRKIIEQGSPCSLSAAQVNINAICHAANMGDQVCKQVLQHCGQTLGRAIAIVINLFNPEKVLISGEIMQANDIVISGVQQSVSHQALAAFERDTTIQAAQFQQNPTMGGLALVKRALHDGSLLLQLLDS
ncbi:ROK family protein [Alginatibacterium sediminis]|uniref:ROK family protein n=1 Tax=Alginatibacterium sediminis TaxID=2164068 RepID=A0A420EHX5_9ALTE|nr:ROK family protein [Alginatibacterium sediminis]RKF20299.1 ROK family protein [Alginatibacterium sediminis]